MTNGVVSCMCNMLGQTLGVRWTRGMQADTWRVGGHVACGRADMWRAGGHVACGGTCGVRADMWHAGRHVRVRWTRGCRWTCGVRADM